ncbi:MAG: hypothetical protein IIT51_00465, partial [Oscillospiraceae bacterium]|nr:hypothetical protein [Oscillospiraceae bacterium]
VTDYVSIGGYVLTGGELAAMVMIDAIARLVPGVLHNDRVRASRSREARLPSSGHRPYRRSSSPSCRRRRCRRSRRP